MMFKEKYTIEERKNESNKVLTKYSDRIPIIVEKCENSEIAQIDKTKFLVPKDLTIGQFIFVIRKRIKLNAEQSLFLIINDNMPPTNDLIINIYERNKDEDGFLYVTYCGENTFG